MASKCINASEKNLIAIITMQRLLRAQDEKEIHFFCKSNSKSRPIEKRRMQYAHFAALCLKSANRGEIRGIFACLTFLLVRVCCEN